MYSSLYCFLIKHNVLFKRQYVHVRGFFPDVKIVLENLLKGFTWDPLLFNVYSNDLISAFSKSLIHSFADDTNNLLFPNKIWNNCDELHRVKSVLIRSYCGPYFPAFGLNMEQIQSECGKIRSRITPNADIFQAVSSIKASCSTAKN